MDIARQSTAPTPQPMRAAAGRLSLVTRAEGRARMPTSEELNLLLKAVSADADRQAFAALFKHFAPRVKSYLVRGGSSAAVAEELMQEAMATVWRRAAAFDP